MFYLTPGLAQLEPAVSSTHFCPAGARKVLLRTCMVPSSAAEQPVEEPHAGDEHVNMELNDPPQRPRAQMADKSDDEELVTRRPMASAEEAAGEIFAIPPLTVPQHVYGAVDCMH